MEQQVVTISVSQPYTLIGGGYTSLRPISRKRDYTATFLGHEVKNTSKAEIQSLIRAYGFRSNIKVKFVFAEESES